MPSANEQAIEDIDAERQNRLVKWTVVAREFNITPQHLLRIRQGKSPITRDVAVAIDRFLGRERGTTWQLLQAPAADDESAGAEPTDERLAEMTNRQIAELAIKYQNERGPEARRNFLQRAKAARDRAVDTLVAESSDASV